jgi:predicted kinase
MSARLIIICGLPGAGKSTHARSLERSQSAIRFNPDEWMDALGINLWDEAARARVEPLQWTLAQRLLELGQTVLIEWGTWSRSERDALREKATDLRSRVELHYVTAPLDVLFDRVTVRELEDPPMTREQLEQYSKIFQQPTEAEGRSYDNFLTIETGA